MPNILTITPPLESHFDHKLPPPLRSSTTTSSTNSNSTIPTLASYYHDKPDAGAGSHLPPPPPYHPRDSTSSDMATTHAHRGLGSLPGPASMTLPDPSRGHGQPLPETRDISHSYPAPASRSSWHREDESSKEWHRVRAEEERRKAEEERTRQEQLRVEQRQIEHHMLREAIHAQIPPHLVPMIFAGLSGGPVAQANFDMAQQYLNDLKQQHPVQHSIPPSHNTSPENRLDAHPAHYNPHHPGVPQTVGPPPPPQSAPGQAVAAAQIYPSPAYASPQDSRGKTLYGAPNQYAPLGQTKGSSGLPDLPRLRTHDSTSAPAGQHSQPQQDQSEGSAQISFHHWQPPPNKDSGSGSGKDSAKPSPTSLPNTNTSRSQQSASQQQSSHQNSPRKRKATGAHEAAPAPTSAGSPSFSIASTGGNGKAQKGNRSRDSTVSSANAPARRGYDPIRSDNESKRSWAQSRETSAQPKGSESGSLKYEDSRSNPVTPQRQASEPPAEQDRSRT